jgi:subtilisin family serine protease
MKSRFIIFLICLIVINRETAPQPFTYFVKFKEDISEYEIQNRIDTKELISGKKNSLLKPNDIIVNHFAKGMARNIEKLARIVKLTFQSKQQAEIFSLEAAGDPSIEYIQQEIVYKIDYTPKDPLISEQWALNKIQAFDAWDITTGSDTVLIGIIDTGIDFDHVDLLNQIFYNNGEMGTDAFGRDKRTNNIDDDENGFVDDYMGWDFTDRVGFPFDSTGGDYLGWDNNPDDEHGHGTYIAGIAAASIDNNSGIAGIAPGSRLINIRAFDPNGYGEEDDVAAALLYALKMGAKVINMSFGDNAFSYVLRDIIRYAYAEGVVLVGSSGNSGSSDPHYPSGYSEVICVGNSTSDDFVAGSSNYGSTLDIVAPGSLIMTTALNNDYAQISGTSASAPYVAGAAALILSKSNFSNDEVKQILKSTTDDIGSPGWDSRSGAGRLNVFNAVSVAVPSIIKFISPTQDYATSSNSIDIIATILSPYFTKYDLYFGIGLNPAFWNPLIQNGFSQFNNQKIFSLDISTFTDTVHNIRLVVTLNNGKTIEERVNFYVDRSPPIGTLISYGPAFYGNRTTVLASIQSNEASIVRMFYRKAGSPKFDFVTLDGFASNNQFAKKLHYGFIPKHLVDQNAVYQIYFQLENLVGLKSTLFHQGDSLFNVHTGYNAVLCTEHKMQFRLNKGSIYKDPTNFLSQNFNEVLFSEFYPSQDLYYSLYKLEGNNFVKVDSIKNKIPRDVGDFNFDGKQDLLSSFQRNGFIDEQAMPFSFNFNNKYSDLSGTFWPILGEDIDLDGKTEILVVDSDTSITVWKVHSNLDLFNRTKLSNFTPVGFGQNVIDAPNAIISDTDNDGKREIWIADSDGDIFSYIIQNPSSIVKGIQISTEFLGSSALLDVGDYNGDGFQDIAILVHSITNFDIAPFYRLLILTFAGGSLRTLYDQAFIDASAEFNNSFRSAESSLRFADLDSDGRKELIVFVFPYSYVFKFDGTQNQLISYKENVNSSSIFAGDLNRNGVMEIAFPTNEGVEFIEFSILNQTAAPYDLSGFSIDSMNIYLRWLGSSNKYYIYRGYSSQNLVLIDSTLTTEFTDGSVSSNTNYYYSVKAFDGTKERSTSDFSSPIKIYCHDPAKVKKVFSSTAKSVTVEFTERISNTIDNIASFLLLNVGIPNSVSPQDQKSLLLNFNRNLPVGPNHLIINGLRDHYGSPISVDTILFSVDTTIIQQEQFFISSHQLINPYKLRITFNIEVDEAEAASLANYSFDPAISVSSVSVDANDKRNITLNWDKQKPVGSVGKEYVLRVKNLRSSSQTGSLQISSGAGSYIVLTGFAKDLSDVYVYPQPAKVLNGAGMVTFANLPNRAKILILNLEGKQLASLEEKDGNGGVEFNLKDQNGNELNSGIYLFRIVRLDENGNEAEEKLGKFAVVK